MTPPFHPFAFACLTHCANIVESMYPFAAAAESSGLPMTILLSGTEEYELISKTEVEGNDPPEVVMSESQSV